MVSSPGEHWKGTVVHRLSESTRNFSALKWYSARQNRETRQPPCLGQKSFIYRKFKAQTAELYVFEKIEKFLKLRF